MTVPTGAGLPPMTLGTAMDLYAKWKGLGAVAVTMADPREFRDWMLTCLAVVVRLGDKLLEQSDLIIDLTDVVKDMETTLQMYVNQHLEAQMASAPDDCLPGLPEEEITGVAWHGTSQDYFDNFAQINAALAADVMKIAKREESRRKHPSAIDSDSTETA